MTKDKGAGRDADAIFERRKKALMEALAAANMSPAEACRLAGYPNANTIYNHYAGRSLSLSSETYERLARVIPGSTPEKLQGLDNLRAKTTLGVRSIVVTMEAVAGWWSATPRVTPERQFEAGCPISPAMVDRGAFGALVAGPGAEKLYPVGTILVCMPPRGDKPLLVGRRYLVRRHQRVRGHEVTVRELVVEGDAAWLVGRSESVAFSVPASVPWPWPNRPWRFEADTYEMLGLVVMSCVPEVTDCR